MQKSKISLKDKAYEDLVQKHNYTIKDLKKAQDDKILFEKEVIGLNEFKKERNERVKGIIKDFIYFIIIKLYIALQDRVSALEYQNTYNDKL